MTSDDSARDAPANDECQTSINQAAAETAVTKWLGWDWAPSVESEGWVRDIRVVWSSAPAGLVVTDEGDDATRVVMVTGEPPTMTIHGWTTVGEAKRTGRRIGEG
jgi:hypothetical protein